MKTAFFRKSLAVVLFAVSHAAGDTVVLSPIQDTTLLQNGGGFVSNGSGAHFFVGRTDDGFIRRGMIMFDIAGSVPAGAIIDSVTLRLRMTRTPAGAETITLHPATADWGQGSSNAGSSSDGSGAPSAPGDATWIHTFYASQFWQSAGGDFQPAASAARTVGGNGFYVWGPTADMTADVQAWLDDPAHNFGWLIQGNEGTRRTTKRFATREHSNATFRPFLTVDFTLPPPPPGDTDADGDVDLIDFAKYLNCVTGPGADGIPASCDPVDFDHDADVDNADLRCFLLVFTGN